MTNPMTAITFKPTIKNGANANKADKPAITILLVNVLNALILPVKPFVLNNDEGKY